MSQQDIVESPLDKCEIISRWAAEHGFINSLDNDLKLAGILPGKVTFDRVFDKPAESGEHNHHHATEQQGEPQSK